MFELNDDCSPLVRLDFSNDQRWQEIVKAVSTPNIDGFQPILQIVENRKFEAASANDIIEILNVSYEMLVIIADQRSMNDMTLLCCSTLQRTIQLRCVPSELWGIENNVRLANMGFEDFYHSTDEDGVFQGFK